MPNAPSNTKPAAANEANSDAPAEQAPSLYERIGGSPAVQRLVTLFYYHMNSLPEAQHIRSLHPPDLSESQQKLYQYFTGWFGGPPLFVERYGHPRLRARHKHVAIGIAERDAWLSCIDKALAEMNLSARLTTDLLDKISPMADHMRNMDEDEPLSDC
ncbi:MAG: group II truncated hemoglobin [Pseudomonadales bacterium]|nr:group II truncated hemoglobin [Pseudomonadales bacterium]